MTAGRLRAVVDCGTNSTRLWLRPDPARAPRRLEQVTRLGRGVDANGHLDDEALSLTLDVVADYSQQWHAAGVEPDEVAIIATSAVRDAVDRDRFFAGVRDRTGVLPVVLSGRQEALASFVGATGAVATHGPTLVVDIGGGSTELVLGHGAVPYPAVPDATGGDDGDDNDADTGAPRAVAQEVVAVSTQLGTVRLTERHLHEDPPTPHQVDTARHAAADILCEGLEGLGIEVPVVTPPASTVVAVAGTATTLAGLALGDDDPDLVHGHRLGVSDLAAMTDRLLVTSAAERLELGPMSPGRADVIAAGALILEVLLDLVAADAAIVSIADILDGAAALWPMSVEPT